MEERDRHRSINDRAAVCRALVFAGFRASRVFSFVHGANC